MTYINVARRLVLVDELTGTSHLMKYIPTMYYHDISILRESYTKLIKLVDLIIDTIIRVDERVSVCTRAIVQQFL